MNRLSSCPRREEAEMTITRRSVLQASLLGAAGIFGPALNAAPSSTHGPTAAERERLAHLAADFMDFYESPGLSVAIGSSGAPVYVEAFGFADKESQEALTTDHRFRIASVTKPITSAGVLRLMEAGKLRLGDHLRTELYFRGRFSDPSRPSRD
jgi:CubicO group peptidase (beta-lactamase class C family)